MTNCIERLTKIYSYNDDIWISDKERGDIVEDRYDMMAAVVEPVGRKAY